MKLPSMSLQRRIILLVCMVLALSLFVAELLISSRVEENVQVGLEEKAKLVAQMAAESDMVRRVLAGGALSGDVRFFAGRLRELAKVEYVVVMDMDGIRYSHPNVERIGQRFVGGDEDDVFQGKTYVSMARGTLGLSVRAFVPVFGADGRQIGAVAVGILMENLRKTVNQARFVVFSGILVGFLLGVPGAVLLARNVRKTLFGLEPIEIKKLFEERSAMLESVREGILAVDRDLRITLVNDEATQLFQKAGVVVFEVGCLVEECIPNTGMRGVLLSGKPEYDQVQELGGLRILTNRVPVYVNGEIVGVVATFRDTTELTHLVEQLLGVRQYAEALRAQTHEFMNRLHVILGMVQMGRYSDLEEYIRTIRTRFNADVGHVASRIRNPVVAGFLLGKMSAARESGACVELTADSALPEFLDENLTSDLVTIAGNLLDNALDAVKSVGERMVSLGLEIEGGNVLLIEVVDRGVGIPEGELARIFDKGYSTKGENRGYGLYHVRKVVKALSGDMDVYSKCGFGTSVIVRVPMRRGEG